jgi:uncharacterized membrane protein YphA (DoxX/SURF4 family)
MLLNAAVYLCVKGVMPEYKFQIAELLVRVTVGILFFFQGYDKLFRIKMSGVINAFVTDAEHRKVPKPVLYVISYYTSIVELIGGLFLIVGLFTTFSLYALALDLVLVCLAFSYIKPMWNMKHVFPRLLLVVLLLLLPTEFNQLSLDYLLKIK